MEIRVLRYFMQVAREENITRAAAALNVSQPTLSKQLKDLEYELGKKLFVRSNYSVKLTDEGMLLRKRAEDILAMVDKTKAEFSALGDVYGGDIHIGCAEAEGISHLIDVMKALKEDYPNIRFHLYSSGTDSISERLDRGLLDFAVIVEEADPVKYNYLKMKETNTWGILMRKDSPLSEKEKISMEDLLTLPLIVSRQSRDEEIPRLFGDKVQSLDIVATYDLIYNASLLVREGFGYVLGFDKLIYTGSESDLCFRPLESGLEAPMYIIWKKYQVFSPVADLLLERLKSEFGN